MAWREEFEIGEVGTDRAFNDDGTPCCLLGWICWVTDSEIVDDRQILLMNRCLDEQGVMGCPTFTCRNDYHSTPKQRQRALELWLTKNDYEIAEVAE